METRKKIFIAVIAIIIIAGCIMVGVKGFNVTLYLREHDTLQYTFDQKFNKDDIKSIAKEVFGDKDYEVRTVEVFDDSVYIISETISEEEEQALLEKLVALYQETEESEEVTDTEEAVETDTEEVVDETEEATETEETDTEEIADETEGETTDEEETETSVLDDLVEGTDYSFYHDSKIRLRDLLYPYILPTVIAAIIIIICMIARYKILKSENAIKSTLKVIGKSLVLLLFLLSVVAILRIPVSTWILPGMMFFVLIYLVINFEIEIRRKDEKAN